MRRSAPSPPFSPLPVSVWVRTVLLVCSLLALSTTVPVAMAGSPDDPEVVDAVGDAGPTPLPAGFEWADIKAAWFEEADSATVRLSVEVVRLDADPPGEVGLHFRVGTTWWIAGWTTIVFPAPPVVYQGGFYCVADETGAVPDTSLCDSLVASHDGTTFLVALPRDLFGLGAGAAIEEPRGYAVDLVSAQPGLGQGWIERTEAGRAFVLPAQAAASPAPGSQPAGPSPSSGPAAPGGSAAPGPAGGTGSADAPAAGWVLVVLGLLGAAVGLRRR